jgi:hypothetical protein
MIYKQTTPSTEGKLPNEVRRRIYLLLLAAFLTALIVQPGSLGSVDTVRRLQTTHSFWTSAPAVVQGDYPGFGLVGRKGTIYSWYGMGQSILMLPSDVIATEAIRLMPRLHGHEALRGLFVSYSVSTIICMMAVLMCFRFLSIFGFSIEQAIAGALTLLFATTFLHYTQNMMENNFILLLTLTGFACQYQWAKTNSTGYLLAGSMAFGANLLTRLTTGMDLVAGMVFVVVCISHQSDLASSLRRTIRYACVSFPCYAFFFALDRAYHFYRFGTVLGTYAGIYAVQYRALNPGLSPKFPLGNPFWNGFLGAFFSPEKSIFLFDPMLLVTILVAIIAWRRLTVEVRTFLLITTVLLFIYAAFHARISYEFLNQSWEKGWAGDLSWGDRYLTTPVQLLALMSTPLLLRHWTAIAPGFRRLSLSILGLAMAIQLASTIFWYPLEHNQAKMLPHPVFFIGLRFLNIAAAITGKSKEWGLTNGLTLQSSNSTTPYFYPIEVLRGGTGPHIGGQLLVGLWTVMIVALVVVLLKLLKFQTRDHSCRVSSHTVGSLSESGI